MSCPECRQEISPRGLSKPILAELGQLLSLKAKAEELALKNAERQGILNDAAVAEKDGKFYGKNQEYANKKCSVFLCNECKKPYFGGLRDCEQDMANEEQNNT
jgi:E3 ubiquitin-protein ligase MYCBP2